MVDVEEYINLKKHVDNQGSTNSLFSSSGQMWQQEWDRLKNKLEKAFLKYNNTEYTLADPPI